MTQGVIKSKIYIPIEDADVERIQKYYTIDGKDEAVCNRCQYKGDDSICSCCPSTKAVINLWSIQNIKGKEYVAIPAGNLKRANKVTGIDFSTYKDLRCEAKFDYDLKFTGTLRKGEIVNDVPSANQEEIVRRWIEDKRYGFICAPPRTGKSVIAVNLCCRMGLKTLFIVHQSDLLDNFMKSFLRDTNLKQLRFDTGKELVKIIEKKKDLEDPSIQVAMITYQKFIREAAKEDIQHLLKGRFGFIIIDEAHQAGAVAYAKFLSQLDCKYRLGMSATPMRKDCMNSVLLNLIGPVTVKSNAVGLIPRVEVIETCANYKLSDMWATFLKNMSDCKERNNLIIDEVFKDLKKHKCILIPVDHIKHMKYLVQKINEKAEEDIAMEFYSQTKNRDQLVQIADSGKCKVIVAIKSMIKQGIDLKLPSMIYIQSPMSAKDNIVGAPMFYQMGNRVCTPYVGKPEPIIKVFVDPAPQSYLCFRSIYEKEIRPNTKAKEEGDRPRYTISDVARKYCANILKRIREHNYNQEKVFNPDENENENCLIKA